MTKTYFRNKSSYKPPRATVNKMKRIIDRTISEEYPNHIFEASLTLCNDVYIKKLNCDYRGIDAPTDVLSFPMLEFDTPDTPTLIGDIVISTETALRQAAEIGNSAERELCFLCVHSALHLLGYDHVNDPEGEKYMVAKQKEIIEEFFTGETEN